MLESWPQTCEEILFPLDPFILSGYFDLGCTEPPKFDQHFPAERKASLRTTLDSSFQKIHLLELYGRNIGANLLGFLIIVLLNLFTPVEFFKAQRAFLMAGGWLVILAFYPLVICIGIGLQYSVQRPISQVINFMRHGLEIDSDLAEKASRRLLNLPFIIGLVNFAMWIVLTALLGIFFIIFRDAPSRISFFVAFRGFMVGYISAILSFFLIEAYSRRRLVRIFFPAGKLAGIPGTIKLSILRRIRVLYGVGTLAPMIILVGTLAFILWETDLATVSAVDFSADLFIFSMVLCGIFIFVGGRLNVLSGKSIIEPITDMMVLVRRVRKGHFKQKVRVVSNDELGDLGDGLNEMTEGLIERDEIRQSLYLAQEVQQTLLPGQSPQLDKLDVAATIVYCDETGGDYYDFPDTCETHPGDFTVTIGDVSGHGIPAALMMATARAFVRQRSNLPGTLVDIVTDVNQQMARDFGETGGFMTLFYLTVDTKKKCLHWVRAGHDPAIFYDPQTNTFEELRGDGIALGVDMDGHYAQYQKTNLKKGQIILLGSDGLWEARNPAGEMFGKETIYEITRKRSRASAREILTSCFHEFNVFLSDRAPQDDVTLVVIKISED
jgi:sigma-B regulation protein RsbU (phosphoserine phosphatase)